VAELSEHDKIALFGNDYKEIEKQALEAAGLNETEAKRLERSRNFADYRNMAIVGIGLAIVIFVTNEYEVSGPFSAALELTTEVVAGLGLAVVAVAHKLSSASAA
jgi:hypothetical protein